MQVRRVSNRWAWSALIVALAILRLSLSARDEVVIGPHDPTNYARLAVHYLTGSAEDRLPSQRPGVGIAAQLATGLGLPYKLFLDLTFLAIAIWAAQFARQKLKSPTMGLILFAAVAFHPYFLSRSVDLMGEPAAAPWWLLLVLGVWPLVRWAPRNWRWRHASALALPAGVLVLYRPENSIIYGFAGLLILAVWIRHGWACWGRRRWRTAMVWGVLLSPALAAWITVKGIEQLHRYWYGIPAACVTEMRGFNELMNALVAIEPTEKIRFVPVTKETLRWACDHSPTMAECRALLLDENLPAYAFARSSLGLEGQVATWLNWHLIYCFYNPDDHGEQKMKRAAAEIRAALRDGRLPHRFAWYPIDPLWRAWIGDVRPTFLSSWYWSAVPNYYSARQIVLLSEFVDNEIERGYFVEGLMRRSGNRLDSILRIHGIWNFGGIAPHTVNVIDSKGKVICSLTMVEATANQHTVDGHEMVENLTSKDKIMLEFLDQRNQSLGKTLDKIPLDGMRVPVKLSIETSEEESSGNQPVGTVAATFVRPLGDWREHGQNFIGKHQVHIAWLAAVMAMLCGGFGRYRAVIARGLLLLLLIGWGLVFGRSLFYTLIEVWLAWGLERYVASHSVLFMMLLVFSGFYVGQRLNRVGKFLVDRFERRTMHAN